jgi:hypothetical protein
VTDAVDKVVTATCTPPSGSTFPIGTTTVTCTARDASGKTGTSAFKVTVTPMPATPGDYTGTTSQGAPIGFTVSSDGRRITELVIGFTSQCSPSGTLVAASDITNPATIATDGTFSSTFNLPLTGGVTGTTAYTFAGKFAGSNAASGTFRGTSNLTSPAGYTCDSGQISWSVSRSTAAVEIDGRAAFNHFTR